MGPGKEFLPSELPTLRDCLRYAVLLQEKHLIEEEGDKQNYPVTVMMDKVAGKVIEQCLHAENLFVPPVVISEKAIKKRLVAAWNKFKKIALHVRTHNYGNCWKELACSKSPYGQKKGSLMQKHIIYF